MDYVVEDTYTCTVRTSLNLVINCGWWTTYVPRYVCTVFNLGRVRGGAAGIMKGGYPGFKGFG